MKKFLLLSLTLMGITTASAAPLTPEEALSRLSFGNSQRIFTRAVSPVLSLTVKDKASQPAVYIFDNGDNNGFLVLSADDVAAPVLGYADAGAFDPNNLPPSLEYWLDTYANQISYARENGLLSYNKPVMLADYAAINPKLTTKWDQDAPYNNDCILTLSNGQSIKCATGCVATALAQVMNYHRYPTVGQGSIEYQPYSNVLPLSLDFSSQPFDWNNMLDEYIYGSYNKTQADAVAYLMKACGYSVKMRYAQDESGANSYLLMDSLNKYFKYSGENLERICFSSNEWSDLIYNHLSNVGPVIYSGVGPSGGHCFVCDGYSGDGYFHINWGWSGLADGYYLLDALNPTELGIGAGLGEYNQDQSIVLAYPSLESDFPAKVTQYGSLTGTIVGSQLRMVLADNPDLGWTYNGSGSHIFNFGVMIEDVASPANPQYFTTNLTNFELPVSTIRYAYPVAINLSNVEMTTGGSYKVTLVTSKTDETTPDWQPVLTLNGLFNYLYVTKTVEGYKISTEEVKELVLEEFNIVGNLSFLDPVKFNVTLSNPAEFELSKTMSIRFIDTDGIPAYTLNSVEMTVNSGATEKSSFTATTWYTINNYPLLKEAQEFKVVLYDENNNREMDYDFPTMTLYPTGEAPDQDEELNCSASISLPYAALENDIYTVGANDVEVDVTISVVSGEFNSTVTLNVIAPDASGKYQDNNVILSKTTPEAVNIQRGETSIVEFNIDFPDADPSLTYMITADYNGEPLDANVLVKFVDTIPATSVEISGYTGNTMLVGETVKLTATVLPAETTYPEVTWSSSDSNIASVDDNGVVKACAVGKAVIMVQVVANPTIFASWEVTVLENDDAAVKGISRDDDGLYRVYSTNGHLILSTKNSDDLTKLDNGLYIINGKKILLNNKSK